MTERDYNKIPNHDRCPFIPRLVLKEKKKLVKIANIKNTSYQLHEKDNNSSIVSTKEIENPVLADEIAYEGTFIKVFKMNFLNSLNIYSIKIFVRITELLNLNNNKVSLDISTLTIHCGIDEPRKIYDGLSQLIELNIIAKTRIRDVYYVNPAIMFRGVNRRILFTLNDY